jgi:hypothetical protein
MCWSRPTGWSALPVNRTRRTSAVLGFVRGLVIFGDADETGIGHYIE